MITIKDAWKIAEKLKDAEDAIFINGILITTFVSAGSEKFVSFKVTWDEKGLTFWRGTLVIAAINYKDITSIQTLTEVYDIKEGRWK